MIVIGSGAGGGTLVRQLAPSRQADPAARARRLAAARAAELAGRTTCSSTTATCPPDTWYDAHGKPFQPQVHYFVGGATKLYGAALYRLRAEDFGELRHHDGVSPAWPIGYDEMEPYYTHAEQLYQVHGARGEDPTEPPASAPVPVPGRHRTSRASSSSSDDLAAPGCIRSTRPAASCSTRPTCRTAAACAAPTCDGFPCLVHAKSDAEVLGVRPALEHANVTLLTNAEAVRLETDAAGHGGHRGGRRARRRAARPSPPTSSSSPAAPPTAPGCCWPRPATRTRTGWPTAPTRSGATTCSTTARRCSRCRRRRTRRCSRRRSGSTTSTSAPSDVRVPDGQHPDGRQVAGADVPRREAAARPSSRPSWTLERRRAPRGRLLAVDRGPAARREPRHAARRRRASRSATRRPTSVPKERLLHELKSMLGRPRHAPRPPAPAPRVPEERDPGRRLSPTRPGTCRFGDDPATSVLEHATAGRTRSTTSTSSTRASSRASAR